MKYINWLLPEIFLIKESCNLVQQETQMATSTQKPWMLPSFDNYIYTKKIKISIDSFHRHWWLKNPEF